MYTPDTEVIEALEWEKILDAILGRNQAGKSTGWIYERKRVADIIEALLLRTRHQDLKAVREMINQMLASTKAEYAEGDPLSIGDICVGILSDLLHHIEALEQK